MLILYSDSYYLVRGPVAGAHIYLVSRPGIRLDTLVRVMF
jgi:hypothetical protein